MIVKSVQRYLSRDGGDADDGGGQGPGGGGLEEEALEVAEVAMVALEGTEGQEAVVLVAGAGLPEVRGVLDRQVAVAVAAVEVLSPLLQSLILLNRTTTVRGFLIHLSYFFLLIPLLLW